LDSLEEINKVLLSKLPQTAPQRDQASPFKDGIKVLPLYDLQLGSANRRIHFAGHETSYANQSPGVTEYTELTQDERGFSKPELQLVTQGSSKYLDNGAQCSTFVNSTISR
jgi:hypothetical protein